MKRQRNKYRSLFIYLPVILLMLAGCKVGIPGEVIPEKEMEELLYDYHVAKAIGENMPGTQNYQRALYIEYVFKKHHTTEAVFDSSMVWYTRHADLLSKIYERVAQRLTEEQTGIDHLIQIRDNKPEISPSGDSIDVWLSERMMLLTGNPLNNKLTFIIPSDSNFKARDTIQWDVYYHFLNTRPDSTDVAFMSLAIQYANDSVINQTNKVHETGLQRIRLQADTLGDIKEIRGYVYYPNTRDTMKYLYANRISLMRYHANDSLFTEKADSLGTEEPQEPEDTVPETVPQEAEKTIDSVRQPERVSPDALRRRALRPQPAQKDDTTESATEE